MSNQQIRLVSRRTAVTQLGLGAIAACVARNPRVALARDASLLTAPDAMPPLPAAWAAAWSSHDPERVVALYAPDALYEEIPTNATVRGADEIRAFVAESHAAFADLLVTPRFGFQAEGWAVLEGDFSARSAEGRPISAPFAAIFELDGDVIRRSADYFDLNTVLTQMGALPPPAPATPAAAALPSGQEGDAVGTTTVSAARRKCFPASVEIRMKYGCGTSSH